MGRLAGELADNDVLASEHAFQMDAARINQARHNQGAEAVIVSGFADGGDEVCQGQRMIVSVLSSIAFHTVRLSRRDAIGGLGA
jgi:hypothetical protein